MVTINLYCSNRPFYSIYVAALTCSAISDNTNNYLVFSISGIFVIAWEEAQQDTIQVNPSGCGSKETSHCTGDVNMCLLHCKVSSKVVIEL